MGHVPKGNLSLPVFGSQRVGKALRFELEGLHSARRGDYRIIYRIDLQVTIIAIEHHADAYR